MISTVFVVALWTLVAQDAGQATPAGNLTSAKVLYASGDYEEALNALATPRPDDSPDEVDEYRALCLLALGRTPEAQHSLETLVARNPLFKMSDADVSPRLVTMFHDVRKRVLPGAVRDLYAKAKTDFEAKNYDQAKPEFEELMTLLADDDLAAQAASLSDMKMLADGFLKLATAQIAAAEAAKAPAPTPVKPPEHPSQDVVATVPPGDRMYSFDDKDVTPPVELNCPLPAWNPSNPTQMREFRGVLRVIINQQGKIESSSLVVPANPTYDPLLLAAVKDWQYKPATREGQPVRYQKLIPILLKPHQGGVPPSR